jgi:hypothetical protein
MPPGQYLPDSTEGVRRLQALRAIMDEVYRLFDRRCVTDTALD